MPIYMMGVFNIYEGIHKLEVNQKSILMEGGLQQIQISYAEMGECVFAKRIWWSRYH